MRSHPVALAPSIFAQIPIGDLPLVAGAGVYVPYAARINMRFWLSATLDPRFTFAVRDAQVGSSSAVCRLLRSISRTRAFGA